MVSLLRSGRVDKPLCNTARPDRLKILDVSNSDPGRPAGIVSKHLSHPSEIAKGMLYRCSRCYS